MLPSFASVCPLDLYPARLVVSQAVMAILAPLVGFVLRGSVSTAAGALGFGYFGACLVATRAGLALEGIRAALLGAAVLSIVFCRVVAVQRAQQSAQTAPEGARKFIAPVRFVARALFLCACVLALVVFDIGAACAEAGHVGTCVFRASRGAAGGIHCERPDAVSNWERMWTGRDEIERVWHVAEKHDAAEAAKHGHESFGFELFGEVQGRQLRRAVKAYADARHIVGWVRNTGKGTVVGRAQGEHGALDELRAYLRQPGGPVTAVDEGGAGGTGMHAGAKVTKVDFHDDVLMYKFKDFRILSKAESAKYEH